MNGAAGDRPPAAGRGGLVITPTALPLYDATDTAWIATIVDIVVAATGQPWRVLRERLEHTTLCPHRVAAILGALRRVTGGRAERAKIARRVRGLVLGHAALDDASREERLRAAGDTLGLPPDEIDALLWIDLAEERPVTLPAGRPAELQLAAFANLDRIQRAVRRARRLRLRVWDDAHAQIRMAARCGLLATIRVDGEATVLDFVGPLSLFHATHVYGRALATLVPLLADHARFDLAIETDTGHGPVTLRVAPPVLLPPVPFARGTPSLASRLARSLAKAGAVVELDPPPIASGDDRLFPDLVVDHAGARWWVELVGFATADYLAAKLARYDAAGITNVLLCVDEHRAAEQALAPLRRKVLGHRGKLTAEAVLAIFGEAP